MEQKNIVSAKGKMEKKTKNKKTRMHDSFKCTYNRRARSQNKF